MLTAACAAAWGAACASSGGPAGDHTPAVPAGVAADDRVETYPVHGRTVAEVRRALALAAPDATNSSFRGIEHTHLEWTWRAMRDGRALGCELHDVRVTVHSTITVPTLVPDSGAALDLADQWARYDAALRRHERGHQALALRTAGAILTALRHVRANDCSLASAEGGQVARQLNAELNAAERQYDDSTGHGRTQGAIWPPAPDTGPTPTAR